MMMIYREFRPPPALTSVVERAWWLEGHAGDGAAEPIAPDGHAEIIVHGGDPFVERREDGTTRIQERVLMAGQMTRAVRLEPTGVTRAVGARLRPDGAHLLFGAPQDALTNHIVDLGDLHRGLARRLNADVVGRARGEEMVSALEQALIGLAPSSDVFSPARLAIAHAQYRRGLVRVPALARKAGLSARQLERVFAERIGLPPKTYLKIIRFQEVLHSLRDGAPSRTWAEIATSHGYYDQAHFIRDFKTFVGTAPSAWQISDESLTAFFSALRRSTLSTPGPLGTLPCLSHFSKPRVPTVQ